MNIKSNAKINLYLNVYNKENELHKIESLIVPISLYDNIIIEENEYDIIEGVNIDMKNNIVYKALCLFREKYHVNNKYKIIINKNIPIGAGLGGGSSNAASVLLFLAKTNNINKSEIIELSKFVGSDVSFFIENKPAIVRGTGDKVEICNFEKTHGVLIFDDDFVSTKDSYCLLDEIKREYKKTPTDISMYSNDLELSLPLEMQVKVQCIKEILLKQGSYFSLMSGSGGSVFGLFKTPEKAIECIKKIENKYQNVFLFETL